MQRFFQSVRDEFGAGLYWRVAEAMRAFRVAHEPKLRNRENLFRADVG